MSQKNVFLASIDHAPWTAVLATVPLAFKRNALAKGAVAITGDAVQAHALLDDGAEFVLVDSQSILTNQECGSLAEVASSGKVFVTSPTASNPTVQAWTMKGIDGDKAAIHVGVRGDEEIKDLLVSGLMLSRQIQKTTPSDLRAVRTHNSTLMHSKSPSLTTTISASRSELSQELIAYVAAGEWALRIEAADFANDSTYKVVEHHAEDAVFTPTIFMNYRRQALLSLLTEDKASVIPLSDFLEICIAVNNAEVAA